MIDIGILGLDTSHAETFAEMLSKTTDATVSAVWDGGAVRDESYVDAFCAEYEASRYEDPDLLVDHVDAVMVLTVNWDLHRPLAEDFLESGIPTFVDKPIAGTLEDVAAIRGAADRGGAPLCGGSAVPHHPLLAGLCADSGRHDLFTAGFNDPFYYGVHLTDSARRICGADWSLIEPTPHRTSTTVTFDDGSTATLRFDGPTRDGTFGFLDVGETIRTASIGGTAVELERMYEPFLESFLETVAGSWNGGSDGDRDSNDESDDSAWLFDAATLLLGVQTALETGAVIEPRSPELAEYVADGAAFTEEYARGR